jgi:hypothetical protein
LQGFGREEAESWQVIVALKQEEADEEGENVPVAEEGGRVSDEGGDTEELEHSDDSATA